MSESQDADVKAERFRRPSRYWYMVGTFMAIFSLNPLMMSFLDEPWMYLVAPVLIAIAAFAFSFRQPSAKRNYPFRGAMVWPILVYALLCSLIVGFSTATYNEHGIWWIPVVSAAVVLVAAAKGGSILDRTMAYQPATNNA